MTDGQAPEYVSNGDLSTRFELLGPIAGVPLSGDVVPAPDGRSQTMLERAVLGKMALHPDRVESLLPENPGERMRYRLGLWAPDAPGRDVNATVFVGDAGDFDGMLLSGRAAADAVRVDQGILQSDADGRLTGTQLVPVRRDFSLVEGWRDHLTLRRFLVPARLAIAISRMEPKASLRDAGSHGGRA